MARFIVTVEDRPVALVEATGRQKALLVVRDQHGGHLQHSSRVPILVGSNLGGVASALDARVVGEEWMLKSEVED